MSKTSYIDFNCFFVGGFRLPVYATCFGCLSFFDSGMDRGNIRGKNISITEFVTSSEASADNRKWTRAYTANNRQLSVMIVLCH